MVEKVVAPQPEQDKIYNIYVGGITPEFVNALIPKLDTIEGKSPESPIRLLIDGYGGGIDPALSLAERLLAMENPLITEARSKCYSAETLILSCGQERLAHPRSRFMMHQAQLPDFHYSGPLLDIGAALRPVFQQNKQFIYMIADNIGFDRHQLYRETHEDRWFGVDKAFHYYHLITDVIPDPIK